MSDPRVTSRVPSDVYAEIERLAEEVGKSRSAYVRMILIREVGLNRELERARTLEVLKYREAMKESNIVAISG